MCSVKQSCLVILNGLSAEGLCRSQCNQTEIGVTLTIPKQCKMASRFCPTGLLCCVPDQDPSNCSFDLFDTNPKDCSESSLSSSSVGQSGPKVVFNAASSDDTNRKRSNPRFDANRFDPSIHSIPSMMGERELRPVRNMAPSIWNRPPIIDRWPHDQFVGLPSASGSPDLLVMVASKQNAPVLS
jgi:hypothetical protein